MRATKTTLPWCETWDVGLGSLLGLLQHMATVIPDRKQLDKMAFISTWLCYKEGTR